MDANDVTRLVKLVLNEAVPALEAAGCNVSLARDLRAAARMAAAPAQTDAEPVAFWVRREVDGTEYQGAFIRQDKAEEWAASDGTVTPLYVHPAPAQTDEAREVERLRDVLERDRSEVARGITAIKTAIGGRYWLSQPGRGSYAYDDDRWREEFGHALDEIEAALAPLQKVAADWSDCPTDPERIARVRTALAAAAPEQS